MYFVFNTAQPFSVLIIFYTQNGPKGSDVLLLNIH